MKLIYLNLAFQKDCECGHECNMPDGEIGVCQEDHWTCAVNAGTPTCLEGTQ